MKIQDLLNSPSSPSSRSDEGQSPSTSPYSPAGTSPSTSTSTSPSSSPSTPPPKKIKLVKDAPVFNSDAQPRGAINFPPYEADEGSELAAQHERFCVQPKGRIAEFVRHIPYASDKKGFSEKTGREGFDGECTHSADYFASNYGKCERTELTHGSIQFINIRSECPVKAKIEP